MKQQFRLLVGLVMLLVLLLGGAADRNLVHQAHLAGESARAEAEETVRLASFSLLAALNRHELAIVAARPMAGASAYRMLLPSQRLGPNRRARPYRERPREELLSLVRSSTAPTPQGLPEAAVAALALDTQIAKMDAGRRLTAGELAVNLEDLAYLALALGVGTEEIEPLARQLRAAPPEDTLPLVPEFSRRLTPHGTVEGWSRHGHVALGYELAIDHLMADAQISKRVRVVSRELAAESTPRHIGARVPGIEALALEAAVDVPQQRPVWLLRVFLWTAMSAMLVGLALAARALHREGATLKRERTFLSNVTHELRTPLASIRLFGETLAAGRGDSREYGELLAQESWRLEALVERVLAVTRLDEAPSLERVRPTEIVESVVRIMAPKADRKGVSIDLHTATEDCGPLEARWDREGVHQALLNLLDNAIEHGKQGGRVEIRAQPANGSMVLSVRDDGPGIPRRDVRRIFARFERGDTPGRGTGLGLHLVERVAQAHGGHVELKSAQGQGSIFALVLPLEPNEREVKA